MKPINAETDGYERDRSLRLEKLRKERNNDNWNWRKTETRKKRAQVQISTFRVDTCLEMCELKEIVKQLSKEESETCTKLTGKWLLTAVPLPFFQLPLYYNTIVSVIILSFFFLIFLFQASYLSHNRLFLDFFFKFLLFWTLCETF